MRRSENPASTSLRFEAGAPRDLATNLPSSDQI
jgi:hypothetical protein